MSQYGMIGFMNSVFSRSWKVLVPQYENMQNFKIVHVVIYSSRAQINVIQLNTNSAIHGEIYNVHSNDLIQFT